MFVKTVKKMQNEILEDYYERTAKRFWSPDVGLVGRDSVIFPLLAGAGGVAIEYGFGSGSLLMGMARAPQYSKVLGVEIASTLIDRFSTAINLEAVEVASKVQLLQPQGDRLPSIIDESCDVLVSVACIEHVIDPYVVLDELHRIAKPSARLICSVPNYGYLKHRLSLLIGKLPRTGTDDPVENWRECGWDGMHLHCFTVDAFDVLLRDCGWQPIRWTGWGTRFGWLGGLREKFPGLLSGEIIAVCEKIKPRNHGSLFE